MFIKFRQIGGTLRRVNTDHIVDYYDQPGHRGSESCVVMTLINGETVRIDVNIALIDDILKVEDA